MLVMKRKIDPALKTWKGSKGRKSLVIFGARQVGKTYSAREFAKSYDYFLEINFELDESAKDVFDGDITTDALISKLRLKYEGRTIEPEKTLIFFDEIQLCPRAFTSLEPFTEDCNLQEPRIPLASNAILSSFKLFYHDTGLLMSMMEPQAAWSVFNGDVCANKGALMENAVSEALIKNGIETYHFRKKVWRPIS
ncbi:MAG: ATP-binding protein [Candidatus Methanoplasma sp.]|jgi:predicted AAA+ superfamily ATPase|nr:ATP-binding protein [Candidatus Methanoplasma sp.]